MAAAVDALVNDNLALQRRLAAGEGPPCAKPWVGVEERGSSGFAKPCCWYRGMPQGVIGSASDVLPIWNGLAYRALRRRMRGGAPKECPPRCPVLLDRRQWFGKIELYDYAREELATFDRAFLANRAAVLGALLAGADDLAGLRPLRLHLHPSDVCNLRCIMCFLDLDSGRRRDWYDGPHLAELMGALEEIKIFGGEPFFCDTSRALILDRAKPRWTHTSFVTNGMLVTERVIEELAALRIGQVDVSLDAAGAASYERIRLRGNFAKALAGARRLVGLSRRHPIRRFTVYADFVVQELNYREVEDFVTLCADLGLTANFSLCADSREAVRRARRQGSALGARPSDTADLLRYLDAAHRRAAALGDDFSAASLSRLREEVGGAGA